MQYNRQIFTRFKTIIPQHNPITAVKKVEGLERLKKSEVVYIFNVTQFSEYYRAIAHMNS